MSADEGGLLVIELRWEFTSFKEQGRFPGEVLAMVPGVESFERWDLITSLGPGIPQTWYTYVEKNWIDQILRSEN